MSPLRAASEQLSHQTQGGITQPTRAGLHQLAGPVSGRSVRGAHVLAWLLFPLETFRRREPIIAGRQHARNLRMLRRSPAYLQMSRSTVLLDMG